MEPYILTGFLEMLQAEGKEENRVDFLTRMDRLTKEDGGLKEALPPPDTLALIYAWKETGEDKYKRAMELVLAASHISLNVQPLAAAYDTAFCKKEHYSEITGRFRGKYPVTGDELIAMVRTVEEMSPEIYEYYRELRDIAREAVKRKLEEPFMSGLSDPEQLKTAYCFLKACGLRILQAEKFKSFFQRINQAEKEQIFDSGAGIGRMIKAQSILLRKQEV